MEERGEGATSLAAVRVREREERKAVVRSVVVKIDVKGEFGVSPVVSAVVAGGRARGERRASYVLLEVLGGKNYVLAGAGRV